MNGVTTSVCLWVGFHVFLFACWRWILASSAAARTPSGSARPCSGRWCGLSVFAIYFLYSAVDRRVGLLMQKFFGFDVPGLGILTVLLILYLVGLVVSNAVGRQVVNIVERVTRRMPLIRTTYQIGKQVSSTLSLPEKQVFKRAVLIEYLRPIRSRVARPARYTRPWRTRILGHKISSITPIVQALQLQAIISQQIIAPYLPGIFPLFLSPQTVRVVCFRVRS